MAFRKLAGLLLLVAVPKWLHLAQAADALAGDHAVLALSGDTFQQAISKNKHTLVKFYAPWCGHCKNLEPKYAEAALQLKSQGVDVVLAKVDASNATDLAGKYGVTSLPTLKWFTKSDEGDQPLDYKGPRDVDGIVQWVKKRMGPATFQADSAAELGKLERIHPAIALGYFTSQQSTEYQAFLTVAKSADDVTFVETTNSSVAEGVGLTAPGFVMIKNYKGEPRTVTPFQIGPEAIRSWMNTAKVPAVVEYASRNLEAIFRSGVNKQVFIWGTSEELESGNAVMDAFSALAPKFKGKVVFFSVDKGSELAPKIAQQFALDDAPTPLIAGMYIDKRQDYMMDMANFSKTTLEEFVKGVVDGTARGFYKSQPIPEEDKDGAVTVVVGKTVDTIVLDESKDVLLKVYAPWCGHCQKLEPVYQELAEAFSTVESLVIAKMDGTVNAHAKLQVTSYPTLFFKPAGPDSQLMQYKGNRTMEALTEYIKEHAAVPFQLAEPEDDYEDYADSEDSKNADKAGRDEL